MDGIPNILKPPPYQAISPLSPVAPLSDTHNQLNISSDIPTSHVARKLDYSNTANINHSDMQEEISIISGKSYQDYQPNRRVTPGDLMPAVHNKSMYQPSAPNIPNYGTQYRSPYQRNKYLLQSTKSVNNPGGARAIPTYTPTLDHFKLNNGHAANIHHSHMQDGYSFTQDPHWDYQHFKPSMSSSSTSNQHYMQQHPFMTEEDVKDYRAYLHKHKSHIEDASLVGSVLKFDDTSVRSDHSGYSGSYKSKKSSSTSSTIPSTKSSLYSDTSRYRQGFLNMGLVTHLAKAEAIAVNLSILSITHTFIKI